MPSWQCIGLFSGNRRAGWLTGWATLQGHEFMGVVEAVGPEVKSLKKGDRAVASFEMACGSCIYCKASFFSGCDRTNPRWAP